MHTHHGYSMDNVACPVTFSACMHSHVEIRVTISRKHDIYNIILYKTIAIKEARTAAVAGAGEEQHALQRWRGRERSSTQCSGTSGAMWRARGREPRHAPQQRDAAWVNLCRKVGYRKEPFSCMQCVHVSREAVACRPRSTHALAHCLHNITGERPR